MSIAILDDLNERQCEAVTHGEGPLLIVAGVGTGKTTVITRRIAWLIAEKRAKPSEILALTFTEKAAREMEERVDCLVPYGYVEATIGTFHGFCDRVLRENAVLLGIDPAFRVLSEAEQVMFLRHHLFELPLDRFRPLGNPVRHLRALVSLFSRAKDEDVAPEAYAAFASRSASSNGEADGVTDEADAHAELAATYAAYQRLLAADGCVDFGDLIAHCLRLFREHASVLERYRAQYRYILVDEFQDTNRAQSRLLELLAAHRNLNACGDDDQSIYRFRGAAIDNILGFLDSYPDAHEVVLVDNYRSTQAILDASYRLIRFNDPDRLEVRTGVTKRLLSASGSGEPIVQRHFDTIDEECDFVARSMAEAAGEGIAYRDMAILVRANAQAEPFLRALNLAHVPWRFSGSRGLYDQEEIRTLTALLRVLADPRDGQSLHYLASSRPYEVSAELLAALTARAKRTGEGLLQAMRRAARTSDEEPTSPALRRVVEDVAAMLDVAARRPTGEVIYQYLTAQTRLLEAWSNSPDLVDAKRVQNVAKLFSIVERFAQIARYDRVPWFVDYLDALIDAGDNPPTGEADPDVDAANVLTIHQAKGLEFAAVYMVGLVDGRFPAIHRRDPIALPEELVGGSGGSADAHRQEERRLFYVGMTRARTRLVLTGARDCGGKRPRKPSQFISEAMDLPADKIGLEKGSPLTTIGRHATTQEVTVLQGVQGPSASELTLSHDKISRYLSCPLAYRYRHVLDVPARPHHGMVYGRAIHRAVAWFNLGRRAGMPPPLTQLREYFRAVWQSEGFLSPEHEELRFVEGLRALDAFHAHALAETSTPELVEERFAFVEGGVKVVGVFDRVDRSGDGGIVIDYKTSPVDDTADAQRRAQRDSQLAIYALAYSRRFGEMPARVELRFLGQRQIIGATPPRTAAVDRARASIATVARGIRDGEFLPTPGAHTCRYCSYSGICPSRRLI